MARTTLKAVDVRAEELDPDAAVFGCAAAPVGELYTAALAPLRLPARDWLFRLHAVPGLGPQFRVEVIDDLPDGEGAHIMVPPGIGAMGPAALALVALDVLHATLSWVAERRGWPVAGLDASRQHALDEGLVSRQASAWKTGPDRRHVARAVRRCDPGGRSRLWIEVERRADRELVAVSRARDDVQPWQPSSRRLRWEGPDRVLFEPLDPLLRRLRVRLAERPGPPPVSPFREPVPPRVEVVDRTPVVVDAGPTGPRIRVLGGGPTNDVPPDYLDALGLLLDLLETPDWAAWWSAADRPLLEISYELDGSTGCSVRRRADRTVAKLRARPPSAGDLVERARLDVITLMSRVRDDMALPPHPPVPGGQQVRGEMEAQRRTTRIRTDRLRALIERLRDRLPRDLIAYMTGAIDDALDGDAFGALYVQVARRGIRLTEDERRELEDLAARQIVRR